MSKNSPAIHRIQMFTKLHLYLIDEGSDVIQHSLDCKVSQYATLALYLCIHLLI